MPRLLSVLRLFPYSTQRPGIGYLGVRSISWNEPLLFEQTFDSRVEPDRALTLADEFLHEDNAYELEVLWDLWVPIKEGDLDPKWTEVWAHIRLGNIYDAHGQRDRAVNEYNHAIRTRDNFHGAQDEAAKYLKQPYERKRKDV